MFDLDSPLVCQGVIGDGCGGGRIFYIQKETLFAYDPNSKSTIELLDKLTNAVSLSKKSCIINIVLKDKRVAFDLSTLAPTSLKSEVELL